MTTPPQLTGPEPTRRSKPARESELRRVAVVSLGRVLCVGVIALAAVAVTRAGAGRHSSSWVWLAATLVVAATVTATRTPLDRLADRVAYGPGGDPYAVLTSFVQRIADTLAVDDVLPHVARTVTQAVHGDRGEVRLWLADGERWRQTWPVNAAEDTGGDDVDIPLRHHGEQVGELGLALAGGALSGADRQLLARLAGTAGLALSNVRLAYDLRRHLAESLALANRLEGSRQRLLNAAAEETRRFSALVEARVQTRLQAVREARARVDAGEPSAVQDARKEATAALAALRELAAGVFPPALADRGLENALDGYCLRYDGAVTWRRVGPEAAARAPLSTEVATYFCAVQAVEDAVDMGAVRLELEQDDSELRLRAVVADRLDQTSLQLLRDRVDATAGRLDFAERGAAESTVTMTWPTAEPGIEPNAQLTTIGSGE